MELVISAQPAEIRVLLVEDCADRARALTLELERSGLRVVHDCVCNAEDMQEALLATDWDIVMCARGMPGLGPEAALALLKSSGREVPFVIHSGCLAQDVPVTTDGLTELADRAAFLELAPAVLAAGNPEQAVACRVDFSRFNRVRQCIGQGGGDALLAQIGRRVSEYARAGLAGRFGESEFAVFRGGFENQEAIDRCVQDLSGALAGPYRHGDLELYIATHMGVSVFPHGGKTPTDLVRNAETALQQCKALMGRDSCLFYFPELTPLRGEHMLIESALFHALRRDQLRLYYQPCVSILTGRVTGVEALVRWEHPELGLLGPDRFLRLAQECGLMSEIDQWVLLEAAWQSRLWAADGHRGFTVAVNVSPRELGDSRLLGRAAMALRETGIAADTLEIEVTESALAHDTAAAIGTLQGLRQMGVRIALDEFRTGPSSLARLERLPVDILKFDRSFVRNIGIDRGNAAAVQAIIGRARDLDLTVHAGGVETPQQLEILAHRGCERAQGYLFARPVPAGQLIPLIGRLDAKVQHPAQAVPVDI